MTCPSSFYLRFQGTSFIWFFFLFLLYLIFFLSPHSSPTCHTHAHTCTHTHTHHWLVCNCWVNCLVRIGTWLWRWKQDLSLFLKVTGSLMINNPSCIDRVSMFYQASNFPPFRALCPPDKANQTLYQSVTTQKDIFLSWFSNISFFY